MYQEHREVFLRIRNAVRSPYVSGTKGRGHLIYMEHSEVFFLCIRNTGRSYYQKHREVFLYIRNTGRRSYLSGTH